MNVVVYRDGNSILQHPISHKAARALVGRVYWYPGVDDVDEARLTAFDRAVATNDQATVQSLISAALRSWHIQSQSHVVQSARLGALQSNFPSSRDFNELISAGRYSEAHDLFLDAAARRLERLRGPGFKPDPAALRSIEPFLMKLDLDEDLDFTEPVGPQASAASK